MSSSQLQVKQHSDNEVPLLPDPGSPMQSSAAPYTTMPSSHSTNDGRPRKTLATSAVEALKAAGKFILYCLAHIALIPIVGGLYVYGARQLRRYPDITPDESDWQSMALIGVFMQLSVIGPIYCVAQPSYLDWKYPPVADWYGSILFYCICALWMERIAVTFYHKAQRRRGELKRMQRAAFCGSRTARTRYEQVEGDIRSLRQQARISSTWLILCLAVLSGVEVALIRIAGRPLDADTPRQYEFYIVMTGFWFLIFLAVNTLVGIGLLVIVYQWRLIRLFAKQKRAEDLTDIRDSQLVARFCGVWQGIILREVQASPAARSLSVHGSMFSLLATLVTAWYLAFRFLYPKTTKNVEDFHAAALLVLAYEFMATVMYILVTVWMQRSIESQHRTVATMHHQLHCAIDAARAGDIARDEDDLVLLAGKSRVVYSLDRLLTTADPRARLWNASLDSLRWTGVNFGLLFVNAFILQIFYAKCITLSGGDGGSD